MSGTLLGSSVPNQKGTKLELHPPLQDCQDTTGFQVEKDEVWAQRSPGLRNPSQAAMRALSDLDELVAVSGIVGNGEGAQRYKTERQRPEPALVPVDEIAASRTAGRSPVRMGTVVCGAARERWW